MARHVDALTSPTLKNLRERWWDGAFSDFLRETLRPRPGNRILDVGCGQGTAELSLGRLRISQLALYAIDRAVARVAHTAAEGRSHNYRLKVAAADVVRLPFTAGAFDATFCVAVLQHVADVPGAVRELARVTRAGGRVLVVEPDNAARYWYSSSPLGDRAAEEAARFFEGVRASRGDFTDLAVGPRVSAIFGTCGIEAEAVELFPVSVTHIGPPPASLWQARRDAVRAALPAGAAPEVAAQAEIYLEALRAYEAEAARAGSTFVEIQYTMLFATVGQRTEASVERDAGKEKVLSAEC